MITNPISNIPMNEKSHVRGWTQLWREQLNTDIDYRCSHKVASADILYIDHGANYSGSLNLFGGVTEEVFKRINLVMSAKNIISLDWDMPDYGALFRKRIGNASTFARVTEEWCDKVSSRIATINTLRQEDLPFDNIIVGDSHTISFSDHKTRVFRNDGKTLHGALKTGLSTLLRDQSPKGKVTLCFGSIDIRHHILRHEGFDLDKFLDEYYAHGNELANDVWYCAPVPVEYEDRKIPKTGFYKGTGFYGSREERYALTMRFIDGLYKRTNKVVQPPVEWYIMDPKKYAETYMEMNSSFHIAPPFYRRNDWGATCFT